MTDAVAVIIRTELRAWRNRVTKQNPARTAAIVVLLGLGSILFGGTLFAVAYAAGSLLPTARDAILGGAFTALAVMMLVVGFPSVIGSYFAGRDLLQLVLAPIATRQIFLARSLFAMSANVLVAALFLAVIAGLGAGSSAPPVYFVLAPILVAIQVLAITAFQVDVMGAVLRVVPARLARDVAVAAAGLIGAALYAAWNLTLRQTFTTVRHRPDLTEVISTLRRIDWLPTAWPGHALGAAITGDAGGTLLWTGLTVVLVTALTMAAAILYESTLLSGLGILGGVGVERRRRAAAPQRDGRAGVASPGLAIARKDWIVLRRDIRKLSRFLPALLFVFVYGFVLVRPSNVIDPRWSGVFVVGFISFFLALLFAAPAIPSERRAFQLLRLAPVTPWQLLRVKVLFAVTPVLSLALLATALTAITNRQGAAVTAGLVLFAVWLGLGCVAIGVSAGAIDPVFDSTDDRRAVGTLGTLLAMGAEIAFGLLSVAAYGLFWLGLELATGERPFGWVVSSPVIAALPVVGAVLMCAGAAALVVVLLTSAASSLRAYEGAISAS